MRTNRLWLVSFVVAAWVLAAALPSFARQHGRGGGQCGTKASGGMGHGQGMQHGQHGGRGMEAGSGSHHDTIHSLLSDHSKIRRNVVDIEKGVRTETTSEDAAVTEKIRLHVRQMKERVESGQPIRRMDPLFRKIFEHADKIAMDIADIPGGVRVTETSDDPQVTLLIRQHAKVVSEFTAKGLDRMHEPSTLPEGYDK